MNETRSEPKPFDVSNLSRLSVRVEHQWRRWLDGFAVDFAERWTKVCQSQLEIKLSSDKVTRFDVARDQFPRKAVGWEVECQTGIDKSLMVFSRPVSLALILQVLGNATTTLPEDRALSEVEKTVSEFICETIVASLGESWPQKETMDFRVTRLELEPHRSRLWEPGQSVMSCQIDIGLGEDTASFSWVMPLEGLETLLAQLKETQVHANDVSREKIEHNLQQVPLDTKVVLGTVDVSVKRLADLKPDDLIVLDHRITDPLPMTINDRTKFRGWLGRKGKRNAFKISEVVEN